VSAVVHRLAALAVAVAVVVVSAPSSSADEVRTCSLVPPGKVTIEAPYTKISARLDDDCIREGVYRADWEMIHRYWGPNRDVFGRGLRFGFYYSTTAFMRFFDTERLGTYDLAPITAQDRLSRHLQQNRPTMVVRLGSRLSLTSSRSGSYVTLSAAARRYSPTYGRFAYWQNKSVALQYKTATGSWKTFKTVTTSSKGVSAHRFKVTSKRSYRAVTADQTNSWGRTSNTVAR
jgi:hypothetical protein